MYLSSKIKSHTGYVTSHIPFFLNLFDVCIEHPVNDLLHVNPPPNFEMNNTSTIIEKRGGEVYE